MGQKNEATPEAMVIESYAIENANLRLQVAQLKIAINKLSKESEAHDKEEE